MGAPDPYYGERPQGRGDPRVPRRYQRDDRRRPPPPQHRQPEHQLIKKGKVSTLKDATTYLIVIEVFIMFILIYQSLNAAGMSFDPRPMIPLMGFFFILMLFLTIFNLELMPIHFLRIRWTTSEREAIYHVSDYSSSAKVVVVLAAFFVVLLNFMNPVPFLDGIATTDDDQTDDGQHTSFSYKFDPYDPIEFTKVDAVTVSTEDNIPVYIYFFKTKDYENMNDDLDLTKAVAYSGDRSPGRQPSPVAYYEYSGELPNEDITVFVEKADMNSTMNVHYTIQKSVDRDFFRTLNLFMMILMIANLAWAITLAVEKHRIIKMYVKREQAKLEKVFTVEEVFLIYNDGRLISHNTRRIKPDVDKDILTGMLTAVQNFVKESFEKDESGVLDEMHYGNLRIMIENGKYANLAVVVNGEEPQDMRERMKYLLDEIHMRYGDLLHEWDGDISRIGEVKEMIGDITPVRMMEVLTPVEEVFLFHRDKRFIAHATKRIGPDVDDALLMDTLEYIQESADPGKVQSYGQGITLPYGEWHLAVEFGHNVFLAALMSERETSDVRPQMQMVLKGIEEEFGPFLIEWAGEMKELTGLKAHLEGVFISALPEKRGRK